MRDHLAFVIPGPPVASERVAKIPFRRPNGKLGIRGFTPAASREYLERVATFSRAAVARSKLWGPYVERSDLRFRVHLHFVRLAERGDPDNLVKGILDGMNTIVYPDDRYVRQLLVSVETERQGQPRTEVFVEVATLELAEPLWQRVAREHGWGPVEPGAPR